MVHWASGEGLTQHFYGQFPYANQSKFVALSLHFVLFIRNVPGVAIYFTGLNQLRAFMATSPHFASVQSPPANQHASVLPKLTGTGNLLSGAAARTTVGFVLNPFAVIKARFEVRKTPTPSIEPPHY